MKKSILATAVALSAGLFASTAMAVLPPIEMTGSTVNFSGNLIPAACEVNVASQNMAIDLGVIDLAVVTAAGATHPLTPFDIVFDNCDTSIATTLDVAFLAAGGVTSVYYANNEATESPSNVNLKISSPEQAAGDLGLPLNGSVEAASRVTLTDGTVSVNYTPKYAMTSGLTGATAGNTLYNVTYKVIYQ